MAAERHIERH